jgi:hypothetical protein
MIKDGDPEVAKATRAAAAATNQSPATKNKTADQLYQPPASAAAVQPTTPAVTRAAAMNKRATPTESTPLSQASKKRKTVMHVTQPDAITNVDNASEAQVRAMLKFLLAQHPVIDLTEEAEEATDESILTAFGCSIEEVDEPDNNADDEDQQET